MEKALRRTQALGQRKRDQMQKKGAGSLGDRDPGLHDIGIRSSHTRPLTLVRARKGMESRMSVSMEQLN